MRASEKRRTPAASEAAPVSEGRAASGVRLECAKEGVVLSIHVQPRAKREGIVGVYGDALKVAIKAPPVDGAANEAVEIYFAKLVKVPQAQVKVIRGQTSRQKAVAISGVSVEAVQAILSLTLEGI